MDDKKWITVPEASAIVKRADRTVRRWIEEDRLEGKLDGKSYLVSLESVLAVVNDESAGQLDADNESGEEPGADNLPDAVRESGQDDRSMSAQAPPASGKTYPAADDIRTLETQLYAAIDETRRLAQAAVTWLVAEHQRNTTLQNHLSGMLGELKAPLTNEQSHRKTLRRLLQEKGKMVLLLVIASALLTMALTFWTHG